MSHLTDTAIAMNSHRELAVYQQLAPFDGLVLVAGAFHGDAMRAIHTFDPAARIVGFEPQSHCWPSLDVLSQEVGLVHIVKKALGVHDGEITLHGPGTDACSILDETQVGTETAQMVDAATALGDLLTLSGSDRFALWALNMEGYEYRLLPYAEERGILDQVDNLCVQYHPGIVTDPKIYVGGPYVPKGFTVRWNAFPTWVWMTRDA